MYSWAPRSKVHFELHESPLVNTVNLDLIINTWPVLQNQGPLLQRKNFTSQETH